MLRMAITSLIALLLYLSLTTTTMAGTPPGFECGKYLDIAHGIVTPEEWAILSSITQLDCEALFYPFEKMPSDTLTEYLESGYFVNDLILFELMACDHFREYHCKDCEPSLSCTEIKVISENYYAQKARNDLGWGARIMMFWVWLTELIG